MKNSNTPIIIAIIVSALIIASAIVYSTVHRSYREGYHDSSNMEEMMTGSQGGHESCEGESDDTCPKNSNQEDHMGMMNDKDMMGDKENMEMKGDSDEEFSSDPKGLPDIEPTKLVKLKDGDIFEMSAEMVQQEVGNRIIKRLAYNRQIPGPIIQVEKDAEISLRFTNNLDIPTTLHSHGIRLDDDFDGVPEEMGGKQKPMQPGETFQYTIVFPDTGVYWYHPHMREDYTQELGLYGNFSVTEEGYWNKVDREEFLVLDDFSENDPFYKDLSNKTLMGRFGNILLINNQENFHMNAKTGEKVRFFVTNTANTRTFDFSIKGQDLKIVGGDIGRGEKEFIAKDFVIAPAERIIFETEFTTPGVFEIQHRGKKIGEIKVIGESVQADTQPLRKNPKDYALIRDNFQKFLDQKIDKKLRISIGMKQMGEMMKGMQHKGPMGMMNGDDEGMDEMEKMMGGNGVSHDDEEGIEWEDAMPMMNRMSNNEMMEWMLIDETDPRNPKTNVDMNSDWVFSKGDFVKVEIFNDPESMHPMQHPIHFHGQRFVVLTRDGKPNENLQWKDTTLLRTGEKIEILIEMSNPGKWIAHCHIAEHMHAGMMFNFEVK